VFRALDQISIENRSPTSASLNAAAVNASELLEIGAEHFVAVLGDADFARIDTNAIKFADAMEKGTCRGAG
jgi:hypothetical protein